MSAAGGPGATWPGPTRDEIEEAAAVLHGIAHRTPVETSAGLARHCGVPVHLKLENLQRAGSFKIRGAYLRMSRLSAAERAAGVVAASAGNHAQGVALAASLLGVPATIVMPVDAALPKLAATRGYGAEVIQEGTSLAESLEVAHHLGERTGRVLIHPYDHRDVVTGQATVGREILQQVPDVRTIIVPTGGGGLLAGVAAAMRVLASHVRVIGVQAETAAAYPASLDAGHPILRTDLATMADGIAVGLPGQVPFDIVREHVDQIRTVNEEELAAAVLLLVERAKQVVEPSGAAGVAALLRMAHDVAGRPAALGGPSGAPREPLEGPVVVVLSGGNVDPLVLLRILRRGLSVAGRYLRVTVRVPDSPGGLATVLAVVAAAGGNVVAVEHRRTAEDLGIGDVDIHLEIEAKGPAHRTTVLEALAAQVGDVLPDASDARNR